MEQIKSEDERLEMIIDKEKYKPKPIFIFSRSCFFKNVSYKPGEKLSDQDLIKEILKKNNNIKGQIHFV